MPYEVQHTTLFYGWRNTWSYAEADGVLHLETFATAEEAQAALDEFFQDVGQEVAAGQMAPRDRGEYRVRYVPAIPVAEQPDPLFLRVLRLPESDLLPSNINRHKGEKA